MTDDAPVSFRCPHCDARISVNEPMRRRLIEQGCVICCNAVGHDDFAVRGE